MGEPDEAKWLFRLLDIHDSGWVELEEFLSGCLRLRGEAKAIDVLTLMQEFRRYEQCATDNQEAIADCLDKLDRTMPMLTQMQDLLTSLGEERANRRPSEVQQLP